MEVSEGLLTQSDTMREGGHGPWGADLGVTVCSGMKGSKKMSESLDWRLHGCALGSVGLPSHWCFCGGAGPD